MTATTGHSRLDGWINALTGMGDALKDAMRSVRPDMGTVLSSGELDTLFNSDYLAYRIATRMPRDSVRQWFSVTVDDAKEASAERDVADDIIKALDALDARAKVFEAAVWARQKGGALIVPGIVDGRDSSDPLEEGSIQSIDWLNVLRPDRLQAIKTYEDPGEPKYGEVELWRYNGPRGSQRVFHESRVIRIRGELTTPEHREILQGWDVSTMQRALEPLQRSATAWSSLGHLLTKSNMLSFGIKGFTNLARGV